MIDIELEIEDIIELEDFEVGIEKMYPELEDLYIVPSGYVQEFKSQNYYGYNNVIVKNVELEEIDIEQNIFEDCELLPSYGKSGFSKINIKGRETDKYKPRMISFYGYTGTELDYELSNLDFSNLTSLAQMFYENRNVKKISLVGKDLSKSTSLYRTFYYCTSIEEIDLRGCDLSNITDISAWIFNTQKLKSLLLDESIKRAKISKCTSAFSYNGTYNQPPCDGNLDLSEWDFSEVQDFSNMFASTYWQNVNLAGVITSKATDMGEMFFGNSGTTSLKTLDFTGCNTSNVTDFHQCFCVGGVKNLDISMFDFSSATNTQSMFSNSGIQNLKFGKNLGKGFTQKQTNYSTYQLGFFYNYSLTRESVVDVFENLYDLNLTYDVANGGTLYSQEVVVTSSVLGKLTSDDLLIATNKGWSVRGH